MNLLSLSTHLNTIFSTTDNTMTNGNLYLCILAIAGIFAIAGTWVKLVKR